MTEKISHHLNQAQDTPFTVEPLLSLIGTDSSTSFSQDLLNRTSDITSLSLSPTIKKRIFIIYNKTNKSLAQKQIIIFPSMNTNKDSKNGKNQRQLHRQEGIYVTITAYFHQMVLNIMKTRKISVIEYGIFTTV